MLVTLHNLETNGAMIKGWNVEEEQIRVSDAAEGEPGQQDTAGEQHFKEVGHALI